MRQEITKIKELYEQKCLLDKGIDEILKSLEDEIYNITILQYKSDISKRGRLFEHDEGWNTLFDKRHLSDIRIDDEDFILGFYETWGYGGYEDGSLQLKIEDFEKGIEYWTKQLENYETTKREREDAIKEQKYKESLEREKQEYLKLKVKYEGKE